MSFNSADIQSFKNVWVFCEQRQGVMMPTTFELISEGRKLANELGVELCGILLGDNVKGIAAAIDTYGIEKDDLILAGRQAIDGDTAQVGPQIAEKLHLPQVTYAGEITKDGDTLTVKRMLEDGYMTIKVKTPCMITCIKELNTPRYLSVGGAFECYSKPLVTMTYETLKDHPLIDKSTIGLAGSPTNILTSFTPPQKGAGMMLEGADKATTDKLAGILAAKHII